ncbi:g4930 [Coccomyxa viridis]|uniref:G4930 protein n=1 Tax=Coccomyxa viridis TaxID=1274662 RepID=A0ABP1FRI9_9CHLO
MVPPEVYLEESQEMNLPKPGEIRSKDFRTAASAPRGNGKAETIRLVQWNIERGYELPKVIEELKALNADIIGLQEVDIGCERSNNVDTGEAIAEALGMNHTFLCEFEELHSPVRDARSQGGGVHGNAILSRYDMSNSRAIEHRLAAAGA